MRKLTEEYWEGLCILFKLEMYFNFEETQIGHNWLKERGSVKNSKDEKLKCKE